MEPNEPRPIHPEILFSQLELDFQIELHTPRRKCCNGMAEERRAHHADIGHIVRMIQDIEGIDRYRCNGSTLFPGHEADIMCQVEIHVDIGWPVKSVPWNTNGTVVRHAVMIIIVASRNIRSEEHTSELQSRQ